MYQLIFSFEGLFMALGNVACELKGNIYLWPFLKLGKTLRFFDYLGDLS